MTVTDIPYQFIAQRVVLGWNEIRFGLDQGLLKPKAAIERAVELCNAEGVPEEIVGLASLTDAESVIGLVSRLAEAEIQPPVEYAKAKWLYLVLAWLWENRGSLVDPLGMVESVYSDFDYPREIVSFVRYMPLVGPDLGSVKQNDARLFDHWKTYLNEAGIRFSRSTHV